MREFDRIINLKAELLFKDELVATINTEKGIFKLEEGKKHLYPVELEYQPNMYGLNSFIVERMIPRTRYDVEQLLSKLGLYEYDVESILKATHGLNSDDYYWFRFEGENITYDDIKVRKD